jgi:predicted RNA-binding protein YlxR (DUF448 family)
VACRTRHQKAQLIRIVRRVDGEMVMDETGRQPGRGAYLCADASCWNLALRRSALQRALRAPLPTGLKDRLEQGAVVASPVMTGRGAPPPMMLGGNHGT